MITNEKYFFKNQSSVSTSGPLYNVNDGTLILQVDGNVSNLELLVLGNTDLIDDNFVTLKTINASNYNMSDKITSTGIYWIDINGIRKIKLNLNKITGSVSVKAITKRGLTTDLVARAMAANSASGGITLDDVEAITGELANLNTEDKSNLVNAINEVANKGSKTLTESTIKYADLEPGNIYYCPNMIHFDYSYGSVNSAGLAGSVLYVDKHPSYGKRVMFLTGDSTLDIITNKSSHSFILSNFVEKYNVLTKTNTTSYTPTSDYNPATKKYVDDSINALPSSAGSTPIYNFAYDESDFYCSYNSINYVVSTNEKNVNRASEIINDMYTNGFGTAIINFYNKNSVNAFSYMCTMQSGSIHNKSTTFTFMAFNKKEHLYTQTYDFDNFRLDIDGTWTDDVFTADEITCQGIAIAFSGGIASVDYVNDQVGNINTILATLTTVSEVSK